VLWVLLCFCTCEHTQYSICVERIWFPYFEAYLGYTQGATFGMGRTSRFKTIFVRVVSRSCFVLKRFSFMIGSRNS
jgi:hypothetical protein